MLKSSFLECGISFLTLSLFLSVSSLNCNVIQLKPFNTILHLLWCVYKHWSWPCLLGVFEDGLQRVTNSFFCSSKVSLSNCVPTYWWEQKLAPLDHAPTRTGDSMSWEQSWESLCPWDFRLQELFGRPGELSMLPGEKDLNCPLLVEPRSWHSFLSSVAQKAKSQQWCWFASFLCWF